MYDLDARIERMYRRDRLIALALVAVLIGTLACVFFAISDWVDGRVRFALAGAGVLLLLFNGASIRAMLRHLREDRRFVYTLDIKHLDEHRASQRRQPSASQAGSA